MPIARRFQWPALLLAACGVAVGFAPSAAAMKVVASSKPVHSLVAAVMEGVGEPRLIVSGNASPHTFTLKPSDARAIADADVFFRISESIEPFTVKLIATLPKSVSVATLADTPGLELHPRRIGGAFEQHGHARDKHGHGHDHDDDANDERAIDGHVWLDPENARKMITAIANLLSERAPEHKQRFASNAAAFDARIVEVTAEIVARTRPIVGRPFVLFHDATQYFEKRFGLAATGSITVSPDVQPSARRLNSVRKKIRDGRAVCVFREPGYQEKLVAAVTEGTDAKAGLLDPEGLSLAPGPGLYVELLQRLALGFEGCLTQKT